MPRRDDINSILIIGAGPIIIGQACEFDYSGAQACKALKAEGFRVILVNSNPATIMTDPGMADATYVEPITPATVARIIEAEKPDALLPTMGGQTALNTALALEKDGTLAKFGVEMMAPAPIDRKGGRPRTVPRGDGENRPAMRPRPHRQQFRGRSRGPDIVGLPAIIRLPSPSAAKAAGRLQPRRVPGDCPQRFTAFAGQRGPDRGIRLGWKEFEMEVVRDTADNCIIVCSIENMDPMGVHTGD